MVTLPSKKTTKSKHFPSLQTNCRFLPHLPTFPPPSKKHSVLSVQFFSQRYLRRRKYKLFACFLEASMVACTDGPVTFEISIGKVHLWLISCVEIYLLIAFPSKLIRSKSKSRYDFLAIIFRMKATTYICFRGQCCCRKEIEYLICGIKKNISVKLDYQSPLMLNFIPKIAKIMISIENTILHQVWHQFIYMKLTGSSPLPLFCCFYHSGFIVRFTLDRLISCVV